MTVSDTQRTGFGLQLEPTVKLRLLIEAQPNNRMLTKGDEVELRLPGGKIRNAYVASFGIETWQVGDNYVTASDPKDPSLTLTLAGALTSDDVPPGTEVWRLHSPQPDPPAQQ
jgi:hypothetical protein